MCTLNQKVVLNSRLHHVAASVKQVLKHPKGKGKGKVIPLQALCGPEGGVEV